MAKRTGIRALPNRSRIAERARGRKPPGVIFYGVASKIVDEVIEFFPSQRAAEDALEQILRDAPELERDLWVAAVEFDVSSAPSEGPAWPRS
jgi:hypothetical protein